jgi:hypothetical protein
MIHHEPESDLRWAELGFTTTPCEREALAFLLPLSANYPDFEHWFLTRVVPGLRDETRRLIRIDRDGRLIGIGIGKKDDVERKICTVRIAQSHFGRGMGLRIFDSLLSWLGTDQPHLTISETNLPAFERIFDYYRFQITSAHRGLYVRDTIEFGYNGRESVSTALSRLSAPCAGVNTNGILRCFA